MINSLTSKTEKLIRIGNSYFNKFANMPEKPLNNLPGNIMKEVRRAY